jgi:hypothetical protein
MHVGIAGLRAHAAHRRPGAVAVEAEGEGGGAGAELDEEGDGAHLVGQVATKSLSVTTKWPSRPKTS